MKFVGYSLIFISLFSCSGEKKQHAVQEVDILPARTVQVGDSTILSISAMLTAYEQLKEGLIAYDSVAVNQAARTLSGTVVLVDTVTTPSASLRDSISNFHQSIVAAAQSLLLAKDLPEKKRLFSSISDKLYSLLRVVQFNVSTLYRQMCPMAFNDNETAYWISNSREVVNPYLGRKHPKYVSGMLHCGEVIDSIQFIR